MNAKLQLQKMAKKTRGHEYSVLTEINTEEEWLGMCEREGLTVVDVYSGWSGPCSAMSNYLKKIKLEVNDDALSYAMAKSDNIPQLKPFQGHCKPIWLFMAAGQPVGVVHGANAPLLGKMIHQMMTKERAIIDGEVGADERDVISFEDAVPTRESAYKSDEIAKPTEVMVMTESAADDVEVFKCLQDLRRDPQVVQDSHKDSKGNNKAPIDLTKSSPQQQREAKNFALLLVEEYISETSDNMDKINSILNEHSITVMKQKTLNLSQEDAVLFSSGTNLQTQNITPLIGTQCTTLLLRCDEGLNAVNVVRELLGPLTMPPKHEEKNKKAKSGTAGAAKKPQYLRQRFYDEAEYTVGFLCPDYFNFLVLLEKYFLDSLAQHVGEVPADVEEVKQPMRLMAIYSCHDQEQVMTSLDQLQSCEVVAQSNTELNEENFDLVIKYLTDGDKAKDFVQQMIENKDKLLEAPILSVLLGPKESGGVHDCQDQDHAMESELPDAILISRSPHAFGIFFPNLKVERNKKKLDEGEDGASMGGFLKVIMQEK